MSARSSGTGAGRSGSGRGRSGGGRSGSSGASSGGGSGSGRGGGRGAKGRSGATGGTTGGTTGGAGSGRAGTGSGAPSRRSSTAGGEPGSDRSRSKGAPRGGARKREDPRGQRAPKGIGGEQVEGRQAVRELLLAGERPVREVLVQSERGADPILDDIVELAEGLGVTVRRVGKGTLESAAQTERPQGVIATAAELRDFELEDLTGSSPAGVPPFLLVLDGVTDPRNLGAIVRSAECAGVNGVVLPRHRAVHVTPAVTKAAAGAVEYVPMCLVGGIPAALARLTEMGVWVVGLDASGEVPLPELPAGDGPIALVVGAEGRGISRLALQRCDAVVSIPLLGQLASLNVSVAAALGCFEVARQRLESGAAPTAKA